MHESYQFNTVEDIVQLNWSCDSCELKSCNILQHCPHTFSLVNILRIKVPKPPHHPPLWRLWGWAEIRLQIWFWGFDAGIGRCQFSHSRTMVRDARLLVVTHSSFQMVQVSFSGNKRCQAAALIRIEIVLPSHAFWVYMSCACVLERNLVSKAYIRREAPKIVDVLLA